MLHLEIASAESVGKRVRWVRKYNNLSQTQFASILGLSRSANLSNWENGHQRLSLEGALAINHHFGTTLDFLYLARLTGLPGEMLDALSENPIDPSPSADSTKKSSDKPVK